MKLRIFTNCIIISALFAFITPAFFLVEYIPKENAVVHQIAEIELNVLKNLQNTDGDLLPYENIKMRKISGLERITYMAEQPHFLINYLKHSRWVFFPYLFATLLISFWNLRIYKRKEINV